MKNAKKPVLNIEHWSTTQGAPVYFVHTPELPMLDIRLVFQAGLCRDGHQSGLSNLTSGLLDEGTHQLSADELAQQLDTLGALYQTGVRHDSAYISLRSLTDPNFLSPSLALLKQMLSEPAFLNEPFERVKNQILMGLKEEQQEPASLAQNAFYKALYPDHPYGNSISGTLDSVKQITRADVVKFYREYYTAQNVLIALVGDITSEKAKEIAEELVQSLPTGKAAASLKTANLAPVNTQAISFSSQQTAILLGQVAINIQSADYFPLIVGNYTLGGGGMVSRLFREVREKKGLVYGIYSAFLPLWAKGPFVIKLQTRNEEAQNAINLVHEILCDFVKNGPTEAELLAAKKNIIGGFPLELAGNANIIAELVRIGFYQFPLDYLDTYRDKITAVTQAQICAAFQKHINPDQLVKVMVGKQPATPAVL